MIMKKKIVSIILAGLMISLTACTGGNTGPASDNTGVTDTSDKNETKEDNNKEENTEGTAETEQEPYIPVPGDVVDGIVLVDTGVKLDIPDNEALNFIRDMKMGWNLGNAFDAADCNWLTNELDYESAWCGAKTSKELIHALKEAGFETIRIPASWHNHVDADDRISTEWLDRYEEVVSWALDEGMYVIINIHHDDDVNYMYPSYDCIERSEEYIGHIWEQLADRFAEYDEHLIFEIMNEPRLKGTDMEWWIEDIDSPQAQEALDCINRMNQKGVDKIRANGQGFNLSRYILVPGYAASPEFELNDYFVIPDDPAATAENRIIVNAHAYTPYDFALNRQGTKVFDIATKKGTDDIDYFMKRLYEKYVCKGIPVLIDEFGALDKDNLDSRMQFTAYYVATARKYGMTCCYWDNNAYKSDGENFRLIDRTSLEWVFPEIVDQMMYYCTERE